MYSAYDFDETWVEWRKGLIVPSKASELAVLKAGLGWSIDDFGVMRPKDDLCSAGTPTLSSVVA